MAPTNIRTVHQTPLLHIESSLDRLRLLSPTYDQRSQQQSGQITLQSILSNKSMFPKATHRTEIRKVEIPMSMAVETLSWWSRHASQHPATQSPVYPWKSPTNLARSPLLVALVGRKNWPWSDISFSLGNLPVHAFYYRAQMFSPPLARRRSSCPPPLPNLGRTHPIEYYQALRHSPPSFSRAATLPKGTKLELGRGAHLGTPSSSQPTIPPPYFNRQAESRRQPVGCSSRGWARPNTRRKDPPTLIPRNQVRRERARVTVVTSGWAPSIKNYVLFSNFRGYEHVYSSKQASSQEKWRTLIAESDLLTDNGNWTNQPTI